MRTAARELHDRRTAQAETLVVVPPPDQLPPHAPGVEIGNRRTFLREHDPAAVPEGQAGDLPQSRTYSEHLGLQGAREVGRCCLPFPPDDHVDARFLGEDALRMVGGVNALVNRDHRGVLGLDGPEHAGAGEMGRRRARVTRHHGVGPPSPDLLHDRPDSQPPALRVEQPDVMAGIEQGTPDYKQPERNLVADPEVRSDGLVRGVDQEDLHAFTPVRSGRRTTWQRTGREFVSRTGPGRMSRRCRGGRGPMEGGCRSAPTL